MFEVLSFDSGMGDFDSVVGLEIGTIELVPNVGLAGYLLETL